jgi:hypothetical protein
MKLTGKPRNSQGKTCPSATLSTTNPTSNDPESNPGLCGERLATNCLSHGTAIRRVHFSHMALYFLQTKVVSSRSQWPRGLRRGSTAARLLGLWVRIPPRAWMSVSCECCVLSGRGLCDELVPQPEESTDCGVSKKCVIVKPRKMRRPRPPQGAVEPLKKKHTRLFSYHQRYINSTVESIVKQHTSKEGNDLVIQRVSHLVRSVFTHIVIGALCNGPVF